MGFNDCWAMWRNKKNKGAAQKKWESMKIDKELEDRIKLAIGAQNRDFEKRNVSNQYIRMFATWLNQRGWDDEIEAVMQTRQITPKSCKCGKEVKVNYPDGGLCIDCHDKKYEQHDWRYHACRDQYITMGLKRHPEEAVSAHMLRVRAIGQKLIDMIRGGR